MHEDMIQKAIGLANRARQKDLEGSYDEALELYTASCNYWDWVIKYQPSEQLKQKFIPKKNSYLNRIQELKNILQNPQASNSSSPNDTNTATLSKNSTQTAPSEEKSKLQSSLQSAIITQKPNVSWNDVAGLENAKEALKEAVIFPTKFPKLFDGTTPWKGVLLYGPPGTGKSYLAQACATECDASFFSISSADLVSKWQGESERLVRTLFEMARENKPSIIFIDEVDSLCSKRSEGENESSRRIKTEFLVQMDGVGKDSSGILVLGATNIPWNLDQAVRRRFERRVYIPLPDAMARRAMIEKGLKGVRHSLSREDVGRVVEATEGYSGADCNIMCRDAKMRVLKKAMNATHFKKVLDGGEWFWEPCAPTDGDPSVRQCSVNDLPSDMVRNTEMTVMDMLQAVASTKPSVGREDLEEVEKWTHEFGQEG